jgi:hypothetical protein
VRTIDEPSLARRRGGESEGDYGWRCADALRVLYALDARKVFAIFDTYVDAARRPLLLDDGALLRIAEMLERAVIATSPPHCASSTAASTSPSSPSTQTRSSSCSSPPSTIPCPVGARNSVGHYLTIGP